MTLSYKKKNLIYPCLLIVILTLILCFVIGCETQSPIKIGFVGTFTGRHYDLGISGRNGATLAVEEANKKGGIKGRKIELIVKDDKHDTQTALKVDKELIEEGVIAIVGHMTSEISNAVLPLINKKKILMISPTVSSTIFDKIDDFFIKASPSLITESLNIANFAINNKKLRRLTIVYDLSNRKYSEQWLISFKSNYERLGGKVISTIAYNTNENPSFLRLANQALAQYPQGIIIIANAFDTATVCQQIRKLNSNIQLFSSVWGMTADLLKHGGSSVENLIFSHIYNPVDTTSEYLTFKKIYIERFGRDPDFASVKSYDAVNIILSSIESPKDIADIKKAILKKRSFKGIQGDFIIDEYGDVYIKPFLITVKNNQFVVIE